MVKHRGFTEEKFITAVGEDLLSSYFSKIDVPVPSGIPLDSKHVESLLKGLNEDKRNNIEEDFRCMNDVAEKGQDYMERAKREFGITTPDEEPRERTAMRLFLDDNPEVFQMAYDYYLFRTIAANLSHHKFPSGQADCGRKCLDRFRAMIVEHYQKQSRGEDCAVRHRADGDNHILFVARGDFVKTQLEWDEGRVHNHYFRPAKEDILVFHTKNRVLSLKIASRNKDDRTEYIKAFGYHVLGKHAIENEVFEKSLVSLTPIQNGSFDYEGNEYIEWVKLVEVQMRIREKGFLRLKISGPDLIGSMKRMLGLSLVDGELLSAKLSFKLKDDGRSRRPVTVELKPPERTSLNRKRDVTVIEDYLRENDVLLD